VTPQGYALHPRWSSDGERIYFRWNSDNGGVYIASVPSEGGEISIAPIDAEPRIGLVYPGAPIHVDDRENRLESWIYEVPELHTVLGWDVPTRGFRIIEKSYKIVSREKVYTKEETFLCMATLPEELADADIVRQIVHAKWGVELTLSMPSKT
jgi:hypothetical protein